MNTNSVCPIFGKTIFLAEQRAPGGDLILISRQTNNTIYCIIVIMTFFDTSISYDEMTERHIH